MSSKYQLNWSMILVVLAACCLWYAGFHIVKGLLHGQ